MKTKRKAFTLPELVIVILIIGILATTAAVAGGTQVKRARRQEASSNIQTLGSNLEDAILDLGYLPQLVISNSGEISTELRAGQSKTDAELVNDFLWELVDVYLTCDLDFDTLQYEHFQGTDEGFTGFFIDTKGCKDPWKQEYRMYYMYSDETDTTRIVISSAGPNGLYAEAAESGYTVSTKDGGNIDYDDDVVLIMNSR